MSVYRTIGPLVLIRNHKADVLKMRLMVHDGSHFYHFQIQYWRNNEKLATFREVTVPVEEVMPNPTTKTAIYQLKNLSPFSNMQLQICVMNTFYVGPPSDPIAFNTVEGGKNFFLCCSLQFVLQLRHGVITGVSVMIKLQLLNCLYDYFIKYITFNIFVIEPSVDQLQTEQFCLKQLSFMTLIF